MIPARHARRDLPDPYPAARSRSTKRRRTAKPAPCTPFDKKKRMASGEREGEQEERGDSTRALEMNTTMSTCIMLQQYTTLPDTIATHHSTTHDTPPPKACHSESVVPVQVVLRSIRTIADRVAEDTNQRKLVHVVFLRSSPTFTANAARRGFERDLTDIEEQYLTPTHTHTRTHPHLQPHGGKQHYTTPHPNTQNETTHRKKACQKQQQQRAI